MNYETYCFPVNLEPVLLACSSNVCKKIGPVCPDEAVVKVELTDFKVGESYCLRIQTKDGYYSADSGYFTIGESTISISS